MTNLSKRFITILVLDGVSIVVTAVLLLRNLWQPAMTLIVILFVANIFLIPLSRRQQDPNIHVSGNRYRKLWFLGSGLLIAACVRAAFFIESGVSLPGLIGVIAGLIMGTLFLLVAKKVSKQT